MNKVFIRSSTCHQNAYGLPSAVYLVTLENYLNIPIFCDMDTDGGGWTMMQKRYNGEEDFNRNWEDYKNGFGNPYGEYWIGNEFIYLLTSVQEYELRIDMEDIHDVHRHAKYTSFSLSSESDGYRLHVSGFSGDTVDSLPYHNGLKFSTPDVDNDENTGQYASTFRAGWWFKACHYSNLNGHYLPSNGSNSYVMCWSNLTPLVRYTTLKTSKMMIRPIE